MHYYDSETLRFLNPRKVRRLERRKKNLLITALVLIGIFLASFLTPDNPYDAPRSSVVFVGWIFWLVAIVVTSVAYDNTIRQLRWLSR